MPGPDMIASAANALIRHHYSIMCASVGLKLKTHTNTHTQVHNVFFDGTKLKAVALVDQVIWAFAFIELWLRYPH
jgi:hypothetical protein